MQTDKSRRNSTGGSSVLGRLALIDLDTLTYIIAYTQFENGNRDNKELVESHVKEYISTILINTRADFFSMAYQDKDHSNFRKYFYPSYKSNRPPAPDFILLWEDTIKGIYKKLGAVDTKVIESDDVLSINYEELCELYEIVTVSGDKDLLQLPGEHYNPKLHTGFYVSPQEAELNLLYQTVAGDSSDGITGISGFAAKSAPGMSLLIAPKVQKLIIDLNTYNERLNVIYDLYRSNFGVTWYSEYLKTKYLVSLLRNIDRESIPFCNEVVELFNIQPCSVILNRNLFT